MDITRTRGFRTAPRQAIVAIYQPDARWPALSRELAFDVVAAMGAANGFSLALGCLSPDVAGEIGPALPAGIDLRLQPAGTNEPAGLWFARQYAARDFERVIVIAADTIGVTTRLLSTASSILASEPIVLGLTPDSRLFAVGVQGRAALAPDVDSAPFAALTAGEPFDAGRARRLEPLVRLRDLADPDRARAAIERVGNAVPRARRSLETGI